MGVVQPTNEGTTTVIGASNFTIFLAREVALVGESVALGSQGTLRRTWPGRDTGALLARLELA